MNERLREHKMEDGFSRPASLAPLKNVAAMMGLVQTLADRGAHMPGFGVVHGPSGYGKTYSAIFAQNKSGSPRVEIGDSWTKKTLMRAILKELGVRDPKGTVADLAEQVIGRLAEPGHPALIVDEADKLVDKGMIELLREIQEGASVGVILIGEEDLPKKLMRVERVHNRVLEWVAAQPCDAEDTRKLARLFCPALEISDALLDHLRATTRGRARRIVVNFQRINEFCRTRGLEVIDLPDFTIGFYDGTPPVRRGAI